LGTGNAVIVVWSHPRRYTRLERNDLREISLGSLAAAGGAICIRPESLYEIANSRGDAFRNRLDRAVPVADTSGCAAG
jgi:hypothetical protein